MTHKFWLIGLFTLTGLWLSQSSFAQGDDRKKLKISVTVTEDGKTTETTKEVEVNPGDNIEELLEELDILRDMEISEDGERMEINIKKSVGGDVHKHIIMDLDNDFTFDYDFNFKIDSMQRQAAELAERARQMTVITEDRPMLGVYVESFEIDGSDNGGSSYKGAKVTKVIEASGAETAGVQQGDIITAINGQPVEGHESLVDQIRQHQVGDEVQLTMMRKGQEMTQTAKLGKTHYKKDVRVWVSPHNEDMIKELEQQLEGMDDSWNEEKMQELQQRLMERSERYFRYKVHADEDAEKSLHKKAFLGITGSWSRDGDQPDSGVKIGSVIPNSTASEMGLQKGDVITRINDDEIQNFESLVGTLKSMEPGQKVKLQYLRNGKKGKANGELKSRAESNAKSSQVMRSWVSSGDEVSEKDISIAITIEDISDEDVEEMAGKTDVALAPTTDSPGFDVEFYPNPNHGQFKLSFDVPNGGDVVIRAVDALGREVYAQTLKGFSGRYSDEIDLGSDNRGVFFLTVEHSGSRFTKKVVIE